jgi:hypothetical protein
MISGLMGMARADTQALMLPAREGETALLKLILHFIPQRRLAQRLLHQHIHIPPKPVNSRSPGHILIDAFWKWVGLLKNHADPAAHLDRVDIRFVNVSP